jgi:hypothetical protein
MTYFEDFCKCLSEFRSGSGFPNSGDGGLRDLEIPVQLCGGDSEIATEKRKGHS